MEPDTTMLLGEMHEVAAFMEAHPRDLNGWASLIGQVDADTLAGMTYIRYRLDHDGEGNLYPTPDDMEVFKMLLTESQHVVLIIAVQALFDNPAKVGFEEASRILLLEERFPYAHNVAVGMMLVMQRHELNVSGNAQEDNLRAAVNDALTKAGALPRL